MRTTTLILLSLLCLSLPSAGAEKPNIIFFIADDVSQEDLGCYGHPTLKSPNIDALAEAGMRFNNAYLTASSCSPSRCSIISGRYPHNTGAPDLHTRLPDDQIRFPELLREAGYYTVLSGKNHMFKAPDRAFEQITRGGGPGAEEDWVDHVKNRPTDEPFFFWFAASDAHRGWSISPELPQYDPADVVVPPYLVDGPETRQDLAEYYHEVTRFDHYIGLVVDELRRQKALDNTLIVVAADNGRPFPRCKTHVYDSGMKTPWVVHYPALVKKAAVTESLISSIDLSATCLDVAGVKKPDCIQGVSFVPILKDPSATTRDMIFAEHNWHVYRAHERMVRFDDYMYIRNNHPDQMNLCLESHMWPAGEELWQTQAAGKTTPAQAQLFRNPSPEEQLFRVENDPHQLTNLAESPDLSEAMQKARRLLNAWTEQTGDNVPEAPTPHRYPQPRIENAEVIWEKRKGPQRPKGEMPGTATGADKNHHPGPIRFESRQGETL